MGTQSAPKVTKENATPRSTETKRKKNNARKKTQTFVFLIE
jgi:hypothetical protein